MELIAAGRDADVFALDEHRVLRRYKDGRPADPEAALITAVHAAGFPAPRVHAVDGPGIVMDRLVGPTLGEVLVSGTMDPADVALVLVDLHRRLHAVPWESGSLLHLDLHPFNVILTPDGPVVIDWTDARPGPPGLDVAMTALIFAQAVLAPHTTPVEGMPGDELSALVRAMLVAFAAASGGEDSDHAAHVEGAAALRRQNPTMSDEELALLDDAAALALRPR
jgi:aminoglycoside phosphotransferase (APT) family kinase protein